MIQIVRTEGVSNAVCLVTLDSDQINLCDNGHYLNHHGVLSLQFVVGSRLMAGVMFPSHLLQNNNCQYVPLFDPPLYIDNFPDEVEPPRVLISYAKLNADHNQGPMTERETQAEDSINLDNFEDNCTKKKIYDLEMELENARIDHQIEIGKVKRTMQDAIDELIAKQAKADIMYKNQQIVSLDIANQRNTFKKMLDNKTQFSDKFEDFSSKILVEHETELKVREKWQETLMIKYENLVEENIRLKRENNKLDESLSVMSSKYNTVNEKFKSEESYIDFFRNKELIYSNVVSSFPDLQIHKLTEQISGLAFTHDNLQKLNFNAQQQLQISEVKINQFRNTNLQLQDKLDCALDLQKANESEIQGLKLQTQILCQEKAKLQQEIDRKLKEICDLRDEIEEMNLMFEDSERDKALKNEEMAHLVNDKQEKLENLEKAYENAVTKLTEKIAHLQASEKKLNQEVSKLTEELEINSHQSEAEKNQMLSAIKLISDDADKQNEKLKETELQLSKSGALLDQANHDNENLASLLKDRQAEVDCLNTHVSELISKVCTLQTSEFNLNQDLAKTKREFEAESADSNSKNQSIIQNLTEKVEALAMEKENLDLCLRNQVQENIQKLQHKQNQIDQLNLTTESCKVSLNELKSVVSCLEEEKTKLKQVNFSQNSRIDELMYVESELARVKSEKSLITQKFIDLNSDLIREQQDKTELHHKFQQICKEKNDIEIQNFELKDQLAASLKESRELVHFRDVYNEFLHEKNTLTAEICELKGMNSQYIDKIESLQRDLHIAKDEKIHLSQEIVSLASAHNPNDPDIVEKILKAYLIAGGHPNNFVKITDGVYCYGNKKVGICIKNGGIVVRVGGGYMYIEEFLKVYVPPEHGNENVSPNKMMTARFNKVSEHIEELDSSIQEINTDIANGILPKKSPSKSPMKSPFRTPVKK